MTSSVPAVPRVSASGKSTAGQRCRAFRLSHGHSGQGCGHRLSALADRELPTEQNQRQSPLSLVLMFGAGKVAPGIITFVSVPIWLNIFGPREYALYALFWATSLIGTALTTGWLRQAILRHSGTAEMSYEGLPRRTQRLVEAAPLVTVVPLALVTTGTFDDQGGLWPFLVCAAGCLLVDTRYSMLQTLAQRDERAGRYAVAEVIRTAGTLAASLGLALAGFVAAWSILAASILATTVAMALLGAVRRKPALAPAATSLLRSYWSFGWPMSLWLTASAGLVYLDRYVMAAAYGAERAGAYAAAADMVVRGMGILVAPVLMFLHPAFMRAWNTGERERTIQMWKRVTWLLTGAAAGAGLAVVFLYELVKDEVLAHPVDLSAFAALTVGAAAWQLALLVHKPLEAAGRTGVMLLVLLLSLAVTAILDALLVGPLAETGVAFSFTAGALTYIVTIAALNLRLVPRALAAKEASRA